MFQECLVLPFYIFITLVNITACIITFNEERNIARCIASLQGVADEILIVDSHSKDNTVAIATDMGAKVLAHDFEGYGAQKYFAEQSAMHDWVFSLDADEALSPELAQSLKRIKESTPEFDAYEVNILANYCGHWIKHCGWYPQPKLRFWNRRKATMLNDKVHEGIRLHYAEAPTGKLKGDLLHYSFNTISGHIKKIEHYSETGARFDVARGKKCGILKLVFAPGWQFFMDYIFRLGILDGYYGYIVCRNSAIASYVKYAKIRQYHSFARKGIPF